jgi:hypothetical protein
LISRSRYGGLRTTPYRSLMVAPQNKDLSHCVKGDERVTLAVQYYWELACLAES